MLYQRDPISTWFDLAARRLLQRAYASRGAWTGVYVGQPTAAQRAAAARLGIWDLYGRDRLGEVRWVRGFKRSVYWNLKQYGRVGAVDFSTRRAAAGGPFASALEWETGQFVRLAGWPSRRWAVRVRVQQGGRAAHDAAARKPRAERIYDGGAPGARWADPAARDW